MLGPRPRNPGRPTIGGGPPVWGRLGSGAGAGAGEGVFCATSTGAGAGSGAGAGAGAASALYGVSAPDLSTVVTSADFTSWLLVVGTASVLTAAIFTERSFG